MLSNKRFKKLLEPSSIGSVKTRNRMIKTGASMMYCHEDDLHMNERAKAYYEALAKGGIGLLIIEAPTVDYPLGARWPERYRIDDDRYIQGLSELTQVIHKHGCPTFMQMNHDGPWQSPLFPNHPATFDGPPVGASPVNLNIASDFHRDVPRELTLPEIEALVDKFASAAVRAQKAGFDGVDINAASSHLLHNFLSPFWNRRRDDYGGSTENRTRLLVGMIHEIKMRAGKDFPVSIILNGIELGRAIGINDEECMTSEESRKIAQILEEAGADAVMVRNHWLGYHVGGFLPDYFFYPEPPLPSKFFPKEYYWKQRGAGANILLAAEMKKVLSIPVIVVGKLSPEFGEKVLRKGMADFIAMTRSLQCDTELPNKIATGRFEDIAPCTACGTCMERRIQKGRRCRINASLGTEHYSIERAEKRKKILVVGGGPAGMEAARVAALRGHEVTLYEKTHQLGGLLPLATLVKGMELENLPEMARYLKGQIGKLGIKTEFGKKVDSSMIEKIKPDVVIMATGGTLTLPEIEGANKKKVLTPVALHRKTRFFLRLFGPRILGWLTKFWLPIGKSVAIIGGGLQGCEVAEFLTRRGKNVTIVDTAETIGEGMIKFRLGLLLDWFNKKGVTMIPQVKSIKITDEGLILTTREGKRQTIEADSIIPISPMAPNIGWLKSLEGKVPEIYTIGDCKEPRLIVDAIADGWQIARRI
jgi:2,4-dienoyl-CoA reductase (NADPH2)